METKERMNECVQRGGLSCQNDLVSCGVGICPGAVMSRQPHFVQESLASVDVQRKIGVYSAC